MGWVKNHLNAWLELNDQIEKLVQEYEASFDEYERKRIAELNNFEAKEDLQIAELRKEAKKEMKRLEEKIIAEHEKNHYGN